MQDTGAIQVIGEAPQSVSFPAMAERQRAAAKVILADENVSGLSSFIGIDDDDATLNTGRMQVALKSLEEARRRGHPRDPRLPGNLADARHPLYLEPVQDLTVEDLVSRTQFQFTLEGPTPRV